VSPNLVHDEVVVIGSALSSVQICTLDGTLVLNSIGSASTVRLAIGYLPVGVYMIKVVNDGRTLLRKLIIQ